MSIHDMTSPIRIAGRPIGPGHPPYVIAEMSGNHNGDIGRAFAIMEAAKAAGADAIKLQTYTADTMTIDHDGPGFRVEGGLWDGRSLYELYKEAGTPWEWHADLFAKGRELGIAVFSSPFDATAIDLLRDLGAPAYKVASFEIAYLELIEWASATGKPLIISTGMANLSEIEDAVAAARGAGCRELVVLHCVSGYPTPVGEANLRTIPDLAARRDAPVGLADHSLGIGAAVAAVALGAVVIEKHVTLSRADGGPDAAFSLEPSELMDMVRGCRDAWASLGAATYARAASEEAMAPYRRSLYVVEDIPTGAPFTATNLRAIRPGYGLALKALETVLGKTAKYELKRGTPLAEDMIECEL